MEKTSERYFLNHSLILVTLFLKGDVKTIETQLRQARGEEFEDDEDSLSLDGQSLDIYPTPLNAHPTSLNVYPTPLNLRHL